MKKLLVFFIVLSFLVPSVFADITIKGLANAELNALQVFDHPADDTYDDVFASLGRGGQSGDGVRTRLDVTGTLAEGTAGYRLMVNWHAFANAWAIDDWAFGWIKPFGSDLLLVEAGRYNQDKLRGKFGDSGFLNSYTHSGLAGNDEIFRRFQGRNGLTLSSAPIENLWIGFGVQAFSAINVVQYHKDSATGGGTGVAGSKAGAQWSQFQLAAGYTIPNIGLARLQLLAADKDTHQNSWTAGSARGIPYSTYKTGTGVPATDAETSGWDAFATGHLIQAAFNLTAVENLGLDVGFGFPIAYTKADEVTYQAPLNLSLGAEYKLGDLGIWGRTDFYFGGYMEPDGGDKQNIPVAFDLHIRPSYAVAGIGKFSLDFGFDAYGPVKNEADDEDLAGGIQNLGFGAWYEKSIAGGNIRIGLAYKTPLDAVESFAKQKDVAKDDDSRMPGIFSIPVLFDVAF
jgi:hypothetical protein